MPISWHGFGPGIINKTTLEDILKLGKSIDEELATGMRSVADLSKEEERALQVIRKTLSK